MIEHMELNILIHHNMLTNLCNHVRRPYLIFNWILEVQRITQIQRLFKSIVFEETKLKIYKKKGNYLKNIMKNNYKYNTYIIRFQNLSTTVNKHKNKWKENDKTKHTRIYKKVLVQFGEKLRPTKKKSPIKKIVIIT